MTWLDIHRQKVLFTVKKDQPPLQDAPRDVVLAALERDGMALREVSAEMRRDREMALAAVKQDGLALEHADEALQADFTIVMAAVSDDGRALQFASKSMKAEAAVVKEAVRQDGLALQHADVSTKASPDIVLEALKKNGHAFRYATNELRANRDVVLSAVRRNGFALAHAEQRLRGDKEIVLAAVGNQGLALQYVGAPLQDDPEVVLAAVCQNPTSFHVASEAMKADRGVVLQALRHWGHAFQYAAEVLKDNREVVLQAVQRAGLDAFQHASARHRADRGLLFEAWRSPANGGYHRLSPEEIDLLGPDFYYEDRRLAIAFPFAVEGAPGRVLTLHELKAQNDKVAFKVFTMSGDEVSGQLPIEARIVDLGNFLRTAGQKESPPMKPVSPLHQEMGQADGHHEAAEGCGISPYIHLACPDGTLVSLFSAFEPLLTLLSVCGDDTQPPKRPRCLSSRQDSLDQGIERPP